VHRTSLVIAAAVMIVAIVASLSVVVADRHSQSQSLSAQVGEVRTALQAAIPSIQAPLIAAARIAASGGATSAFTSYANAEVGANAPFRSITLWKVGPNGSMLVALAGARPEILTDAPAAGRFISRVPATSNLSLNDQLSSPVRVLGFAERLPEGSMGYVVYAESAYPMDMAVSTQVGSPFAGLRFAAYLGRSTDSSDLIERSIPIPVTAPHTTVVVPFGDSAMTIIAVAPPSDTSLMRRNLPWLIVLAGLAVALTALLTSESQIRRRQVAELSASDSATRFDTQRDIASTLQRAMLPEAFPEFDGLEIATTYVAGEAGLEVGGDWFDAIAVDQDHLLLTVGDVSGRGLHAASLMSYLRHSIRAFALQGDDPATIVARLDAMVDVRRDEHFATVVCVGIDVPAYTVTLVSAGHPAPVIVDETGARLAEMLVNAPLGVGGGASPQSTTIHVEPGTTIIAYTDGLVERRGESLDDGFARLVACVADGRGSAAELVDRIVGSMSGAVDDLAIIAAQWTSSAPTRGAEPRDPAGSVTKHFERDANSIVAARRFVAATLSAFGDDVVRTTTLLTSELATNAVVHAESDFDVSVATNEPSGCIRVAVRDHGHGDEQLARADTMDADPHGRGLMIVARLADRWGVDSTPGTSGRTVWFEIAVDHRSSARSLDGREAGEEPANTRDV